MPAEELSAAKKVAKTAADGVGKALSTSPAEEAALLEIAGDSRELKMAAHSRSRTIAIKQEMIRKFYSGLGRLVGIRKDYFDNEFAADLASKTAGVPEDRLIEPRASVVLPAMQSLGFSLDEPELKEMYLNLLAAATDRDRADKVHPAFAEVIRQLSPPETEALNLAFERGQVPIVEVRRVRASGNFQVVQRGITPLSTTETGEYLSGEVTSVWIDNWVRLGLASTTFVTHLADDTAYRFAETHPDTAGATLAADPEMGPGLVAVKGSLSVTDFGDRFFTIVSGSVDALADVVAEADPQN